jgi:hypothetical protein
MKNPYQVFVFKKNEGFNFHKFYESLEKYDSLSLIEEIKIN